jgi:TonB-dependent SusC/RagA subfamily outer membrane receptor
MGKKKKFEGTVTFQNREIPSLEKLRVDKSFNKEKTDSPQRGKLPDNATEITTLVKDVALYEEIENDQVNKANVPKVYSKADFSFSGEELVKSSRTSLINALKGRVPGLAVVNGYLRLGGPSSFMGPSSTEPLLILDGLQITSGTTERLNQINPEIVERVDVIKYGGGAIYGSRGANGVIIVTTKSGDGAANQSLDGFALAMPVMGFSKPAIFVSPDYSQVRGDVQPDYRSTIYWSPQVITDKIGNTSVTFYASDIATRYKIVVEGVSAAGDPLRGVFFIDVVK